MSRIKAYAAKSAGAALEPFEYTPAALGDEQVEIAVDYCGICHSDLSVIHNSWGNAQYPLVPGHEVSGRIVAAGDKVKKVKVGDRVGLGWFAGSCTCCTACLRGDHNLCASGEETIIGRAGGFAERVRARYDAIVCMYHDQALIPVKALGFDEGVNVTLGLPFIRTSPDHGTALSLAGTGKASPESLLSAIALAARMAKAAGD